MAKKSINEYYTGCRIAIDKRLESGATIFFQNLMDAEKYANQTRSYPYQVFDGKRKHCGYAVPK